MKRNLHRFSVGVFLLDITVEKMEALQREENTGKLNTEAFASRAEEIASVLESLPVTYSKTVCEHMKRLGYTAEVLSEESSLTVRTISRHRSGEIARPPLANVIALCVGLKLHPVFALDLIRKAGHNLTPSKEDTIYLMVLLTMVDKGIMEVNRYLEAAGMKTL